MSLFANIFVNRLTKILEFKNMFAKMFAKTQAQLDYVIKFIYIGASLPPLINNKVLSEPF